MIWLPRRFHAECVEEAKHWRPLETGGVLMGYWNGDAAVITALIAAGPNAIRESHNFEPDQEWQLAEIARCFNASDGRETYLGDWHSHPGASTGQLSGTDRRVLRTIIEEPAAHTPRPIMVIFFGGAPAWEVCAWATAWRTRLSWLGLQVSAMALRLY